MHGDAPHFRCLLYRFAHSAVTGPANQARDIIKSCPHLLISRSTQQSLLRHLLLLVHLRLCRCRLRDTVANQNPNCLSHPHSWHLQYPHSRPSSNLSLYITRNPSSEEVSPVLLLSKLFCAFVLIGRVAVWASGRNIL